jgi:hypothetical protein
VGIDWNRLVRETFVDGGGWQGKGCGIPHLAKNERDMGHPSPWVMEGLLVGSLITSGQATRLETVDTEVFVED